jgi:hypothetical protein
MGTSAVSRLGKAGYRFTATGTFDRLLTGLKVINDGGGGHPQPALFYPTIRVPLRTPRNEGQKKILSVDGSLGEEGNVIKWMD